MEKERITQEDYVRYDRVWQRVAPELDPYPAVRQGAAAEELCPAERDDGAAQLAAFIDQALACRRAYLSARRCAPTTAARRTMQQLAEESGAHARRLTGLYYILTGQCYRSHLCAAESECLPWCRLLRLRWQEACYAAEGYRRAAEAAADGCVQGILLQMAEDQRRHASVLLHLLEGNLPG